MKKILALCLMAAFAICGCQVKEEGEFAPEGKVFMATTEAYIADGVETKTSMDSEGNVIWKAGDQVSIFAGSTVNEHYQVTDASNGKTAASLNRVESPGFVAGGEINNNVAFYPYSETAEIAKSGSAYVIRDIDLPSTQYYASASFGNGAFPMTAVTSSKSDYNLKFMNVLGGLKLQLKGTATIASISITGNNSETLCGAAEVTVSTTSAPSISLTDASATIVTLDCGDGVQLNAETATPFIIALPAMTMERGFTVTVTDTEGGQMEIKTTKSQTITRSNLLKMPVVTYEGTALATEHHYVDLGLPSGLKWATCNVGATAPEEYGDYFAWGETEPYYTEGHSQDSPCNNWKANKTGYNWASYKFGADYLGPFSKYVTNASYGTIDNKTVLDPEDDAAYVNWGGTWRMPTDAECLELRTECTWTWTSQSGVRGCLVTGPNGNSIFLPASGMRSGTGFYQYDTCIGNYWSSSLKTDYSGNAYNGYFDPDEVLWGSNYRFFGFSVRPVTDEDVRVSVTSISLNKSSIKLGVAQTASITATVAPSNATQNNVIWSSSNSSVATVSWEGVVTAVAVGNATITATTYDGGLNATCAITVNTTPEAIDLGLPSGLKWASFNVGATAPEEFGDYFAWGEVETYYSSQDPLTWKSGKSAGYDLRSYKWCLGSGDSFTKYCTDYDEETIYGTVDNKTILELEDDTAHANLGGNWRMPTIEEWRELMEECTWTYATQSGVNGYLITGLNGNSIFLPAAGIRNYTYLYDVGSGGYYWSSCLHVLNSYTAWYMSFDSDDVYTGNVARHLGHSVRPVTE